jgi:uncharacterized protein YjbJ (UPF0337 family)
VIWERIERNWKDFKRNAKQRWSRLSDRQLSGTLGKRAQLARSIQEAYGSTPAQSENQIADWQAGQKDVAQGMRTP